MFSYGGMVEEVATFSDSYRAACKETRKIMKRKRDTVRQTHTKHTRASDISLQEAAQKHELYAAALGACESKKKELCH